MTRMRWWLPNSTRNAGPFLGLKSVPTSVTRTLNPPSPLAKLEKPPATNGENLEPPTESARTTPVIAGTAR